jgi:hypothetical protein
LDIISLLLDNYCERNLLQCYRSVENLLGTKPKCLSFWGNFKDPLCLFCFAILATALRKDLNVFVKGRDKPIERGSKGTEKYVSPAADLMPYYETLTRAWWSI